MLHLIARSKSGEIRTTCALSTPRKELNFSYEGKSHDVTYKHTKYGNYFLLKGVRYYFKVYSDFSDKWIIDCDCF